MRLIIKLFIIALVAKAVTLPLLFLLPSSGVEHKERFYVTLLRHYPLTRAFGLVQKEEHHVQHKPIYRLTNLKLKALYATSDGKGIIALQDRGKLYFVSTGKRFKGYRLIKIEPDKAIFEKDTKHYELKLQESALPQKYQFVHGGSHADEPPKFAISKQEIQKYKHNPKKIWANIAIEERFDRQTNQLRGFEVVGVKRNSLFDRLGLKKGDIIIGANGRRFRSFADVLKLYNTIDKYDTIRLTIIRNNQEKELEYALY